MSALNIDVLGTSMQVKFLSLDDYGHIHIELLIVDDDTLLVGFPAVLRPGESFEISGLKIAVPITLYSSKRLREIKFRNHSPTQETARAPAKCPQVKMDRGTGAPDRSGSVACCRRAGVGRCHRQRPVSPPQLGSHGCNLYGAASDRR